ncbi:response regulator transcription factor [Actinomycetes bacterium M1A6_2h]
MVSVSPPRPRVLVVEDNESIRVAVAADIGASGALVHECADGSELEKVLDSFRPDLVILDIMLPGRDGIELMKVVRGASSAGVILLTARDAVEDRVHGLAAGADDYVVKPFAMAELLARVDSVLRRLGRVPSAVTVGDIVLDTNSGDATRGGHDLELTTTEWRLLSYLAAQRGRTVSKTQILTQVWGYDNYDANLVEVHVSALRRKLEAHGPRVVHTRRGIGYVLTA